MFLLLLAASQALASPVVVPGGALYSAQQSLLRGIILPYYPVYPFTNWRLITQDVVIDIDVDYDCEKEVLCKLFLIFIKNCQPQGHSMYQI